METKYNFIQSVGRALSILEQFQDSRTLGVTTIANRVGIHKSTCFGLIHTLQLLGYIQQDAETGQYCLGLKAFELGQSYISNLDLRTLVRPFLTGLMERLSETVHLVVVEGHRAVYIDKVETMSAMTISSRIGCEAPLHCTGVGKGLLAFMPEEERAAVLSTDLKAYTEFTITDPVALDRHLAEIRALGYAVDDQEREIGLRCVAAPIFNARGQVVAAISVSGPSTRVTQSKAVELAETIVEVTREISRKLGYRA
ncbi:MAG: IclR family transcriptional regulator [Phyllobacteriaceae bacterium]|nr:IclR family transcriptional regulator [Phyllobacteriaceae bacterium]